MVCDECVGLPRPATAAPTVCAWPQLACQSQHRRKPISRATDRYRTTTGDPSRSAGDTDKTSLALVDSQTVRQQLACHDSYSASGVAREFDLRVFPFKNTSADTVIYRPSRFSMEMTTAYAI